MKYLCDDVFRDVKETVQFFLYDDVGSSNDIHVNIWHENLKNMDNVRLDVFRHNSGDTAGVKLQSLRMCERCNI